MAETGRSRVGPSELQMGGPALSSADQATLSATSRQVSDNLTGIIVQATHGAFAASIRGPKY
jgi:hypothetical protein